MPGDLGLEARHRLLLRHAPAERLHDRVEGLLGDPERPVEALDLVRALDPPRGAEALRRGREPARREPLLTPKTELNRPPFTAARADIIPA